jgi:signal transduction histidine kinase
MLQPNPDVAVLVDCDPGLAAHGDPMLLEQAVSSIATNAVEHTARGTVTIGAVGAGPDAVIRVADSGSGIPLGERAKIFDRFHRAGDERAGFGLGLSIARDAIRVLGGAIDITSEEGRGTTVELRLPAGSKARV